MYQSILSLCSFFHCVICQSWIVPCSAANIIQRISKCFTLLTLLAVHNYFHPLFAACSYQREDFSIQLLLWCWQHHPPNCVCCSLITYQCNCPMRPLQTETCNLMHTSVTRFTQRWPSSRKLQHVPLSAPTALSWCTMMPHQSSPDWDCRFHQDFHCTLSHTVELASWQLLCFGMKEYLFFLMWLGIFHHHLTATSADDMTLVFHHIACSSQCHIVCRCCCQMMVEDENLV